MLGLFTDPDFLASVLILAGVYGIFSMGLQVQVGFGGLLNFGQVGFMAIGAYTLAIVTRDPERCIDCPGALGLPLWQGMLFGVCMAVLAALIIGLPTLSLRADYLAITAIAASEIVRIFALNSNDLTGGPQGILAGGSYREQFERPMVAWLASQGFDIDRKYLLLAAVWLVALSALLFVRFLMRTPWGRVLRAVREDEDAVRALGKNAYLYKLQALMLGAALGALAGMFFSFHVVFISPASFEPIVTFIGFVILILGGIGSVWGTLLAATIVQLLLEGTRFISTPFSAPQEGALRFMVIGLVLMLLVALRPQGLLGKREEMVLEDNG